MNTPLINNIANKSISPKYLPNKEKYGEEYGGYRNKSEEIIFNKFAATSNDVSFIYNNIKYYIYKRDNIVKVYNANIKEVIKEYLNETEFFENFSINGILFIEVIDEISDVNVYIDVFTPHLALDKKDFHTTANIHLIKRDLEIYMMGIKTKQKAFYSMILEFWAMM